MAITKEINLVVETDEAVKNVNKLNKSVESVEQSAKDLEKQNVKTSKSAKGIGTAIKGIGAALKAAGIGLVIALFAKLVDVISQNQKVMDVFSAVSTSLSIAFNDLFSIFENGLPSISELGNAIKNNLIERFRSLIDFYGLVGRGLKQLFEGDFAGAAETAKQAGKELIDVATGVDNAADKISNYVKETYSAAEATVALANASRLAEARLAGLIEKYDREAEIQRERRDNFNLTAQERLEASEKLRDILNEQEKAQLRQAQISIDSARAQIKATGDNIDNQEALIRAENEYAATLAQVTGFRTEQQEQDRALRKEILDARKEEIGEVINTDNLVTNNKINNLDAEVLATLKARQREAFINKKAAEKEKARAKYLEEFKYNVAQAGLAALGNLAESGSAFAKGIAIAQAIISTYQGINKALAETTDFTPTQTLRFANAAAVGIAGFANVANILKTNSTKPSGGGVGSVPSAPAAPSFNVVGTGGVNQLAQTLNQEQDPVKAFVVGGDVTSQQEMDRDIINTATID